MYKQPHLNQIKTTTAESWANYRYNLQIQPNAIVLQEAHKSPKLHSDVSCVKRKHDEMYLVVLSFLRRPSQPGDWVE